MEHLLRTFVTHSRDRCGQLQGIGILGPSIAAFEKGADSSLLATRLAGSPQNSLKGHQIRQLMMRQYSIRVPFDADELVNA
jgi:hypothetical protein